MSVCRNICKNTCIGNLSRFAVRLPVPCAERRRTGERLRREKPELSKRLHRIKLHCSARKPEMRWAKSSANTGWANGFNFLTSICIYANHYIAPPHKLNKSLESLFFL